MRLKGVGSRASASGVPEHSTVLSPRTRFRQGEKVEVRSDDEGFRGVWYEAEVLRHHRGGYMVSYATLLSEKDPSKPLCEVIHRSDIRPLPPPPSPLHEGYRVHASVEAFHKDGWWSGVVSGVLTPDVGKYTVCFPTSREEIEFGPSEIRPRLHWVSARRGWIPAEEMDTGEPTFKVGDIVEVSRERENHGPAWLDAKILKAFNSSTFLVEYNDVKSEGKDELLKEILDIQYMRVTPPLISYVRNFASGDEVEVHLDHGWLAGTVLESLDNAMYAVKLSHCEKKLNFDSNDMRYQGFWTGSKWVYNNKKAQKVLDLHCIKSPKTNKKTRKRCSCEGEVADEHNAVISLVKWIETKNSSKSPEFAGTTTLSKSIKISSSEYNGRSELGDNIEFEGGSTIPSGLEIENCISATTVEDVSSKEEQRHFKNQPPQDYAVSSHDGSMHEAETIEANDSLVHVEHCDFLPIATWSNSKHSRATEVTGTKKRKKLVHRPTKRRNISLDVSLREQTQNQVIDKIGDKLPDKGVCDSSGPVRCEVENPENSPVAIMGDEDSRKDYLNQVVLGGLPENGESMLIKASKFCDSPSNAIITAAKQIIATPCEDNSDAHDDPIRTRSSQVVCLENERVVLDPQPDALPPKKMQLPFVKCSAMWESIEAMEIFNKIPQEPHFRPLEQHSINFREGMAIGLMISFANLVSSIEKVTISEATTEIENKLRDLEPLEANGFNVTCIRMRLEELLQIQVNWTETKSRKTMLEAHMLEIMDNNERLDGLIISYDEAIRDLEDNIARIHEKKDLVMRTKEDNESALVNIKREACEVEEASGSFEEHFITKSAAPW